MREKHREVAVSGWRALMDTAQRTKRLGLRLKACPFMDFSPGLLLHTSYLIHLCQQFPWQLILCSYRRLLNLSLCVFVSFSVSYISRQGVTLMTCICGNTSSSLINTQQLEKQSSAPVYNGNVCTLCVLEGGSWGD